MAPNLAVQAEVVDLRSDIPTPDDAFLVDTNVWCWATYTRAEQADQAPRIYQVRDYPAFISTVLSAKARLHWCGISLAELAHLIEKTEWEIFRRPGAQETLKEYRHNFPNERAYMVVQEIQSAWTLIRSMAQPLDMTIDEAVTNASLARLETQKVDGYDLFLLEAMSNGGITQIITDDADFTTVPGIQVFTANQLASGAAAAQGKLVVR